MGHVLVKLAMRSRKAERHVRTVRDREGIHTGTTVNKTKRNGISGLKRVNTTERIAISGSRKVKQDRTYRHLWVAKG